MNLPLTRTLIDLLTRPEPKLPFLQRWLLEEVWTPQRFEECGDSPCEYLKGGEKILNEVESLLTAAADSYFNELRATPAPARTVQEFFGNHPDGCIVVLDGCSLRELPRLVELARLSRRPVIGMACGHSAIPSSTEHFISECLGLSLPTLGPSELLGRPEFKTRNIRYYYFQSPGEHQQIPDRGENILLWHRFPDMRFMDSTASNADMYDGIWDALAIVWKNTVQELPSSSHVLITSDHGYVFLGAGLNDTNLDQMDRPLKGKRFREFPEDEVLPDRETPGLFVDPNRRLAVIQGRCHNRPQAPSASRSIYRHGGISLMEVLTPWYVLGPMT